MGYYEIDINGELGTWKGGCFSLGRARSFHICKCLTSDVRTGRFQCLDVCDFQSMYLAGERIMDCVPEVHVDREAERPLQNQVCMIAAAQWTSPCGRISEATIREDPMA